MLPRQSAATGSGDAASSGGVVERPGQGEAHGVIQISGGEARATLPYRDGEAFEEDPALVLRQIVGGGHHGRKLIVVDGEHG